MKKIVLGIVILGMCTSILVGCGNKKVDNKNVDVQENQLLNDIESKLIRFHVIASSDNEEDQSLKLKVRDEVLKYMQPKLNESKSLEQSRELLKKNDDKVKAIAKKVIKDNGYNYDVTTTLGKENFPDKTYGNITLPQGEYEAYRIVIGPGDGQNWWCVMFPPLCFVDMSKGQVAYEENEEQMKKVLSDEEYNVVDNTEESQEVEVRFKLWDTIKEIFS